MCISHNRKKGKTRHFFIDEEENSYVNREDLLPIRKDVEKAMGRLAPNQKAVFFLHDVQGYTHNEISEMMKCTVGTSKSQLFKARMKMRKFLKGDSL
jgi:RNA polymerase sigma-70 factor (ECF subfamily)